MSRTTYHGKRGGRNARVRRRVTPYKQSLIPRGREKKRVRKAGRLRGLRGARRLWSGSNRRGRKR